MWYLVPKSAPENRLLLAPNKDVRVGRSDGHVTVDDRSVSRRHAQLRVSVNPGESQENAQVVVKDTSKFGTLINGKRVVGDERHLQNGDVIIFGAENINQFILKREPLVVCCSAVNAPTRALVREKVAKLGGQTLSHWTDECTLLVVSKVSVTIKVIGALIRGAPIVRPDYLDQLTEFHSGSRAKPPDPSEFQPVVSAESQHLENVEIDLLPRSERRRLFAECTFVFLTKSRFDRLASTLKMGGAKCLLWEEERPASDDPLLVTEGTMVFFEESPTPWAKRVYKLLTKHRRRPIVDAEIGFAVLACSREDFCNVKKKCDQLLYRHGVSVDNLTQNPFDLCSEAPAAPEPSPSRPSAPTPRRSANVKLEPNTKPTILVPKTPPVPAGAALSPPIPQTSITTVPESMDLKVEAPNSEEPFRRFGRRRERVRGEDGEGEGEEEDPFDSIRARGKRRGGGGRQDSIARSAPPSSEGSIRVFREESDRVERAYNPEKSQSTGAISRAAELSASAVGAVDGEEGSRAKRREKRRWETAGGEEEEEEEEELVRKRRRGERVEAPPKRSQGGGEKGETVPESNDSRSEAQPKGKATTVEAQAEADVEAEAEAPTQPTGRGERSGWDPGLPRNRLQVVVKSLLRRRHEEPPRREDVARHESVRNFKAFRKVHQAPAPRRLRTVALVASQRARLEAVEGLPVSQGPSTPLDSEADRVFEEMLQMPPRRRLR